MKSHTPSEVTEPASPMPPERVEITAFDFDGTLTFKDSFNAFLIDSFGITRVVFAFFRKPSLLINYLRTGDRGALKSRLLFVLCGAMPKARLDARIKAFVAKTGMQLFRSDALEAWQGAKGLRVIVTASPELLVAPFGALIGADRVIGTRLGFSSEGALLPDLDGPNCRGPEKVRRLKAEFGEDFSLLAAYGDTSGDTAMLAAAKQSFYRVFKDK